MTNIQTVFEANQGVLNLAFFMFWGGAVLLSLYIRKVNDLSYSETLLAALGLRKIKRNWIINLGGVLVTVVPLVLMVYVISSGSRI